MGKRYSKKHHRKMRAKGKTRHHVLNKCKGGHNYKENIVYVDERRHNLWHQLFGNKHPYQVMREIMYTWTSDVGWTNEIAKKRKELERGKEKSEVQDMQREN